MKNISILLNIRKVVISLMGFGALLIISSCQDILDENPKAVVAENYYNTASEFETAVNAIYSPLRSTTFIGSYMVVIDTHTDWGFGRGSRAALNDFQGLNSTWKNAVGNVWSMFYLSIRNANYVIKNASDDNMSDEIKKFVAEAKFLRAFNYFHLVNNWGGVPIRTESNMEDKDIGRSSVDAVYDLIVSDLKDAEANLPEKQSHIGRPTKYSAKTMLADVYIHLEMFTEARDKAKEVIDSQNYSLVPLETVDGFTWDLWGPEVLTTPEEIFYLKFSRQQGQGNYMPWVLNHPSTGLFNFGGAYAHYSDASLPFYKNWNDNDLRKGLWDMINFGLGDSTLVSRKFADQNASSTAGAGTDFPLYRYSEVLYIYAEAATRVAGGPTEEAVEALNMVHRRAFGENPLIPSSSDFDINDYNKESFIDLIIEERGYEFIFEGKRWLDLKRTNKARELIKKNRGFDVPDKHFLWPIHTSEMDFNDAINEEDQNPGY